MYSLATYRPLHRCFINEAPLVETLDSLWMVPVKVGNRIS